MSRIEGVQRAMLASILGAMLALGSSISVAAPLPSESLVTAPLVTPASAWTFYGSGTTHTNGVAAWAQRPPEIQALARALGAGRYSAAQYTLNVVEYVRRNIATEFRFGLSKGARGALIDQSGTSFDQANLMVELLRQGGVTASYKVGTITLTPQQFGQWSGFIKNLNQGAQTFDVDARAACQFIADGGIPATVNGATSCTTLSGNMTTVTLGHIWVAANGNVYDPSFKPHTFKSGIDIAATMQCGTLASPTCGATANSAAMAGSTSGTFHGVPSITSVNETGLSSQLRTWAINVQNYITANQPNAQLDDIVGGPRIDSTYNPTVGATLPYTSALQFTWTGDIPNQYRTTLTVQFLEVTQLFYADEISGKRLQLDLDIFANPETRVIRAEGVTLASATCTATCSALAPATVFLTANHPYAAQSGAYADDTASANVPDEDETLSIVQSWGDSGPSHQSHYLGLQEANNALFVKSHDQPTLVAQYLVQQSAMHALLGQLGATPITRHHTIGVAFCVLVDFNSQSMSTPNFTIQHTESANSRTNDSVTRASTFETASTLSAMLEGSLSQQTQDGWDQISGAGLLVIANRSGQTLIDVPSASMASVIPSLTNYTASQTYGTFDRTPLLQAAATEGYEMIISTNGFAGTFGVLTVTSSGDIAFKSGKSGLLIGELRKGGNGAQTADQTTLASLAVKETNYSLKQKKYVRVDPASGGLDLSPPPDIVTGAGEFPMSLPFQRHYTSDDSVHEDYVGDPFNGAQMVYTGPGSVVSSHLGSGWTHNYEISAIMNNDAFLSLGLNSAIEASSTIADVYALLDVYRAPAFNRRLTGAFASYWLGQQFISNAVTLDLAPAKVTFVRLPDGTLHAPAGSSARLVQTGGRSTTVYLGQPINFYFDYGTVALTYTDATGNVLSFDGAGSGCGNVYLLDPGHTNGFYCWGLPRFKPTVWTFATGVKLTFQYQQDNSDTTAPHSVLSGVSNNLGRSLTFALQQLSDTFGIFHDWRILSVTDDSSRQSTFGLSDCPGMLDFQGIAWPNHLACNTFTATTPGGLTIKDDYLAGTDSPDPATLLRSPFRLRRWFTPSDAVNAFETVAYDDLFRVKSLTDKLAHQSQYFVGGLFDEVLKRSDTLDPTGGLATNWFDRKNSLTKTIDPLGRTTVNQYDDLERLTLTTLPESNTIAKSYDVRSNVLVVTRHAKPGSGLADVTSSTTYMEGPAILQCANILICNRPATSTSGNGRITNYSWDSLTGLPTQVLLPADPSGNRPETDLAYSTFGTAGSLFSLLTTKTQKITPTQNNVTGLTYNASNHYVLQALTEDQGGLNLVTNATYDVQGNITQIDGPRSDVSDLSNFTWDADRRLIFRIQPDPDGAGPHPRPAGRFVYDVDGQLAEMDRGTTTSPTGSDFTVTLATTLSYDGAGNKTKDATSTRVTQYSYDAADRPLCTAVRMNPAVFGSLPSDACTLGTSGSFGTDRIRKLVYDTAGQVLQDLRAFGTAIQQTYATYTYSPNGKLASVTDADGSLHVTNYTFDGFDRPYTTTFADGTFERISSYDNDNNVLTRLNRAGQTLTFTYDNIDRTSTKAVPVAGTIPANTVTWTYNLRNDVVALTDTLGNSLSNVYDNVGRLTSASRTTTALTAKIVTYQYDAAGNRTRLTWPDGYYATYAYDAVDHPTTVTDSGSVVLATYDYDNLARRASVQFAGTAGAKVLGSWSSEDDLATLVHDLTGTVNDVSFTNTFSPAHQWSTATITNPANRFAPGATSSTTYGAVNAVNQYPTVGPSAIAYDANGNLSSDGTWTFLYDPENKLMTANKSGTAVTFAYDPTGRRTSKVVNSVATSFVHDGQSEIAEYDGSGALLRRYVPGPAANDVIAMVTASATRTFFHPDKMGSVIAMSDTSGNLSEGPYTYDEYGNCFVGAAPCATGAPFRFTGQRLDPETGLYYYRARYYSSLLGRFLQTDPIGYKDDLNLYSYVGNDPTDRTDPTGKAGQGDLSDDAWIKVVRPKQEQALRDVRGAIVALKELNAEQRQLAAGQIKALSPKAAAVAAAVLGKFGSNSAATVGRVTSMFGHVESVLADNGAHYNYSFSTLRQTTAMVQAQGLGIDPKGVTGYSSEGSSTISLTGAFFNNQWEQETTLIHEPTHIFGTQDYAYGVPNISAFISQGFPMEWNADSYSAYVVGH